MTIANSQYAITMAPQSGNTYLTTGNIPFNCPLTVTGATGANIVLNSNIIMPESANGVFTFNSGGFNANAKTVNAWSFVTTGSSVRYFNQNGGTINLTGSNVSVVDFASTNWSTNVNPTFNLTYSGSTGNRVVASYFTSEATSISYNVSGADSVAIYGANNVNFAGFSGNFYTVGNTTVYGNLLLSSTMNTIATNSAVTIAGSARTLTVDTANQTVRFPLTINASGSNVTLANGFVTNPKPLVISAGNTTVIGNVTVSAVSVTGTAARTLDMGNGSWTVTGTGNVWLDSSSNVTYVPGNTTVEFTTDTAVRSLTFSNTANLNNVIISGNTANSMANISGNLTLNTLSANIPVAWNLNLGGGKTYTMQNWTVTGSANNMVTLGSTVTGTKHNLVLTGGGNINTVDWLQIRDSNASPALTWYPGANSIDLGGVTGWVFPALNSSNFFLVF